MRKLILVVGLVLAMTACSGDEGTTSAGVETLCREYCTCSDNANPQCLDECTNNALHVYSCARNEWQRYISCMTARSCDDPFDDCKSNNTHPNYEECYMAVLECQLACEPNQRCDENSPHSCEDLCTYDTTCELIAHCADCRNANQCWVTGECETQ